MIHFKNMTVASPDPTAGKIRTDAAPEVAKQVNGTWMPAGNLCNAATTKSVLL